MVGRLIRETGAERAKKGTGGRVLRVRENRTPAGARCVYVYIETPLLLTIEACFFELFDKVVVRNGIRSYF